MELQVGVDSVTRKALRTFVLLHGEWVEPLDTNDAMTTMSGDS